MNQTEKLDRLIKKQVIRKWKCPIKNEHYLEIKKVNYINEFSANVVIGCCTFERMVHVTAKE
jgi:hypothetical protein